MNSPGDPPAAAEPLGSTTITGVTVWPVLAGRVPGQTTGLQHLTWGGEGDAVHRTTGGVARDGLESYGQDSGTVSGPCHTKAQAQHAVEAYLAGLEQEPAPAGDASGLERSGSPAAAQARASAGATRTPATEDQTARILAEYGTPEQRLGYALMEAERIRREGYETAQAQYEADGTTPAARQRFEAAYDAARAEWTGQFAFVVAEYARELGATAPVASPGAEDPASPYNHGLRDGASMLVADITHRPGGYDDREWLEYVAGYAEGAQCHAEATAARAQAAQRRALENPPGPLEQGASPGGQPAMAHGAAADVAGRGDAAASGLAARPDFPGAPANRPAVGPGRRTASSGIASPARPARPGRPR